MVKIVKVKDKQRLLKISMRKVINYLRKTP